MYVYYDSKYKSIKKPPHIFSTGHPYEFSTIRVANCCLAKYQTHKSYEIIDLPFLFDLDLFSYNGSSLVSTGFALNDKISPTMWSFIPNLKIDLNSKNPNIIFIQVEWNTIGHLVQSTQIESEDYTDVNFDAPANGDGVDTSLNPLVCVSTPVVTNASNSDSKCLSDSTDLPPTHTSVSTPTPILKPITQSNTSPILESERVADSTFAKLPPLPNREHRKKPSNDSSETLDSISNKCDVLLKLLDIQSKATTPDLDRWVQERISLVIAMN